MEAVGSAFFTSPFALVFARGWAFERHEAAEATVFTAAAASCALRSVSVSR